MDVETNISIVLKLSRFNKLVYTINMKYQFITDVLCDIHNDN